MIDPKFEKLVALSKAAKLPPNGGVHVSTIHRWHLQGIRGIKLETLVVGGRRYTSREALARFYARTTKAADANASPSSRAQAIEQAEAKLDAAGI